MEVPNEKLRRALKLPIDLVGPQAQEFLNTAQKELGLGSVRNLEIDGYNVGKEETTIYLNFYEDVKLEDEKLGKANGVYKTTDGDATLVFDKTGYLKEYAINRASEDEEAIGTFKAEVENLLNENAIYFAEPGESIDLMKLPKGQDFAISIDSSGKKILERVRFA